MSNSFIKELVSKKEEIQIAFLQQFDIDEILKVICSFLNTDGGWILIGYKNSSKTIQLNLLQEDIISLESNISNRIFPQPLVYSQLINFEGNNIILINVLKGSSPPYSFDKNYFIRRGSESKEANSDEISQLLRSSNEFTSTWEKLTTIDATLDDLDEIEIEKTINEADKLGKGKSLPNTMEGFLSYFQLLDYNSVKNGALVLFGLDPVKFHSQCRIRITIMPEGKTGNRFDDTLIIEDNLFIAFQRVSDYFRRNLPMISQFDVNNWDRNNKEKYPSDALDEAVVNAMVHRDYGDISGDITINIYTNKIEIINSGEIPTGIINNKNIIKAHHSILRNPTIAHMFYLRGKMEKLGRGLSLIKERFNEHKLKDPEWSFQNGYTTLTLFGVSKAFEINDRMSTFIRSIIAGNSFTREDYELFFDRKISEKTARIDLTKLIEGNWITKMGDGPSTKYIRTSVKLPDITG